jgi:glycolate oxidase
MGFIEMPQPDAAIVGKRDQIVAGLRTIVPGEGVITDPKQLVPYETDAFTAYRRVPLAVVLPETTEQVAALMKFCSAHGVPVVPRGAGTSLAGGAIPQEDAVVIGLSKMRSIVSINYANRTAVVQVGITNLAVSDAVTKDGFFYAPDPSSQLACTIGGNIGMNSGGAHCLKYGVTTNNLLGLKLVLMDGTVVDLGGEGFDGPGYDLVGLLCGSEGQLGIITEATVRLLAQSRRRAPGSFRL